MIVEWGGEVRRVKGKKRKGDGESIERGS